jgi:hypothetical protein
MALKICMRSHCGIWVGAIQWVSDNAITDCVVSNQLLKGNKAMQWNLENLKVSARYLGDFPVQGIVTLSRVKYGGGVSHHIKLDLPLVVYGAIRDSVIVEHADIYSVSSS